MDFILNGQAQGNVASSLMASNFNVTALRPYIGSDGRHYISSLNANGKLEAVPTQNANATLRKEDWKILDDAIVAAAKPRLRVVADLRGQGLTYSIPNGMGKTVLETERRSDVTPATISMDPARQGEADRNEFDLQNLPLPVIHKDFFFNARQVMASRNGGSPIDTTFAEDAARRVSEEAERLATGTADSFTYGGGTIYGLKNFPDRITKVITIPTDSGWTPVQTMKDVLTMRQSAYDANHYGPYQLYVSPAWDEYMDDDYSDAKGDNTLRQRINNIENIQGIRTADYLGTGFHMILVQMTSDVIREVIGMDITTVQWETHGGMRLNFKVMAILVPQLRADWYGNTGIVHGTGA